MKKHHILPALLAFTIAACDGIEEPLKLINETCVECSVSDAENFNEQKVVLLEEFTGATCISCPAAAAEAEKLKKNYPDQVVVLAIHAGTFAVPHPKDGFIMDFRTPEGTEYFKFAQPYGVPSGIVDRLDQGSQFFAKHPDNWEQEVIDILDNSPEADIGIIGNLSYNDITDSICLEVKFKALSDLSNDSIYWAAFLAESGIVAPQEFPNQIIDPDYVHNHVLRNSFNGTFGEPLVDFKGSINSVSCSSRTIVKDAAWNKDNLEVIIIAYNFKTYELLQAIQLEF